MAWSQKEERERARVSGGLRRVQRCGGCEGRGEALVGAATEDARCGKVGDGLIRRRTRIGCAAC